MQRRKQVLAPDWIPQTHTVIIALTASAFEEERQKIFISWLR